MIKRKYGVKSVATITIVIVMLIITVLPVWAASFLNEVNVLDDFVVQLKNPSPKSYFVTVKIVYQDKDGDIIYEKKVTNKLNAFETMTIDAKDFYNSERTQKISVEITDEVTVIKIILKVLFHLFIILSIVLLIVSMVTLDNIYFICSIISVILFGLFLLLHESI